MSEKRIPKVWKYNPKLNIEIFDQKSLNKDNLINQLLVFRQEDLSFSLVMELFGSFNGQSLCNPYDLFEVPANMYYYYDNKGKEYKNKEPFTTTIGIWIYNIFFLRDFGFSWLFNGYINETIGKKKYGSINQTLVYALIEDKIKIEDYKKYLDYNQFFMPFEDIISPNHTENILTASKLIEKKKNELLKKYENEIANGDFIVSEKIEKELLDYAKEMLKDDPGLDVYMSEAASSWKNNFKNMYIMKGAIKDPDPNAKQQFNVVTSNYINGISADEYSLLANSLAAGPYSRGKKTETGGYWEKLITSAFQTITLNEEGSDCGTKRYIEVNLTNDNITLFMYNYIIKSNGELEELTMDTKDKYIGKKVKMRFSIYCESKTGICNHCAGNFFYRRGTKNIGLATVQVPSKLKTTAMKAFHDSTINTVEIDPMKAFGLK